jgi:hypothetical protein
VEGVAEAELAGGGKSMSAFQPTPLREERCKRADGSFATRPFPVNLT